MLLEIVCIITQRIQKYHKFVAAQIHGTILTSI